MEQLFEDLHPVTLILIILLLIAIIVAAFKLIIYFARAASQRIVDGIITDIKSISAKVDRITTSLELNTITMDAMHGTFEVLFNGEYAALFNKKKNELMQNAVFLRQNIQSDN